MNNSTNDLPEGFKMTELGPLPEEWGVVNVDQSCSFGRGTEPGSNAYNREGIGIPFIRVGNVAARTQELVYTTSTNVKACDVNDILMTLDGSPGVVTKGFKGAYSSGIRKVSTNSSEIYKDYLFFVLQTEIVKHTIEQYTTGVTIKHASKALPHMKIPLPTLSEQKIIARILSIIQRAIEAQDKIIAAAMDLKKSFMRYLFTYGPVPVAEAGKVLLKETEIGPVPEHWEQKELGEVCDITYGVQAAVANLTDSSIGIPILTNINIRNEGMLDISTLRYYPLPDSRRDRLILKKGDVLFNWRSGSPRHVGKTAIFDLDGDHTFSSFILRFRANVDIIGKRYLFRYLNFLKGLGFFTDKRSQSSVNSVFNASLAAKIPVFLPPASDQTEIVVALASADRKLEIEENRKAALQGLFKTMLHQLMTGKVRVNNLEALVL